MTGRAVATGNSLEEQLAAVSDNVLAGEALIEAVRNSENVLERSKVLAFYQAQPRVYVSGNLFIYYEEGNPQANIAPDVFVVFGAPKRDRPSYLLWSEPKAPDFVLEITSRRTRREDQETKPEDRPARICCACQSVSRPCWTAWRARRRSSCSATRFSGLIASMVR